MIAELAQFCVDRSARVARPDDRGLIHATLDLYREAHRRDDESDATADFRLMRADPLYRRLFIATTKSRLVVPIIPSWAEEARPQ